MKQTIKTYVGRTVALLTATATVAVAMYVVPLDSWRALGEQAALLSAGMRRPTDGAQLLDGWLERQTAGAGVTTTTPPTQLGEGVSLWQTTTTAPTTVPSRGEGGGDIITQQMSAGSSFVNGVAIRNKSGQTVDIAKALQHTPALGLTQGSEEPQVLIMHTHTTECYMSYDAGYYNENDPTRTEDSRYNMIAVGKRVAAQLEAAGIGVLHDTTIHDQPYTGSYVHSQKAVRAYSEKYPSIRVVLDLHRDAVYEDSTTYIKPTATVNGQKAAQMMIIVGMKNTESKPNDHTAENLAFGARLQQQLHQTYTGLMRPLLLADAQYNQQLTNGSLLIEMGGHANTLEEACYSGDLLGEQLALVLKELGA